MAALSGTEKTCPICEIPEVVDRTVCCVWHISSIPICNLTSSVIKKHAFSSLLNRHNIHVRFLARINTDNQLMAFSDSSWQDFLDTGRSKG